MDIKESELIKEKGWKKADMKKIREQVQEFEGISLWYRVADKKPKQLQAIMWTPTGVMYLEEFMKVKDIIEKNQPESIAKEIIGDSAMTKGEFNKIVNGTRWIGKISRNSYKNNKLVLVEHETGFNIIANCKDNMLYAKNRWVIVDTLNNNHSIRKPAFKIYEQAQKQKI
jgi:hypothetical protein